MCLGFWLPIVLVLHFGCIGVLLLLLLAISWCFGRVCVLVLVGWFLCCDGVDLLVLWESWMAVISGRWVLVFASERVVLVYCMS